MCQVRCVHLVQAPSPPRLKRGHAWPSEFGIERGSHADITTPRICPFVSVVTLFLVDDLGCIQNKRLCNKRVRVSGHKGDGAAARLCTCRVSLCKQHIKDATKELQLTCLLSWRRPVHHLRHGVGALDPV